VTLPVIVAFPSTLKDPDIDIEPVYGDVIILCHSAMFLYKYFQIPIYSLPSEVKYNCPLVAGEGNGGSCSCKIISPVIDPV
jgi:hypothetical protein